MINKITGQRELSYVVKIEEIKPIEGYDRVEYARVGGWWIIVRKDQFKVGDLAIYIEIDSKVPEVEPFLFLEKRHYRVKTLKMCKVISQGLLMSAEDFGWEIGFKSVMNAAKGCFETESAMIDGKNAVAYAEGDYLTSVLGITYADEEDNKRKANSQDKYKLMTQRKPNVFKQPWAKWLMKREWGRKVMFAIFGRKKDNVKAFPTHFPFIHKSDEERIENMPYILENRDPWIKTLKIDGTSSTYILERKPFGRFEYYVLSRNVRQLDEKQDCFHEFNVYWYNSNKYHIKDFLMDMLKNNPDWTYCCIQGESAGANEFGSIQGNPHKLDDIYFYGFNFIDSKKGRWNSIQARDLCEKYNIPWVPILDECYILPTDMKEMKLSADGPCDLPNSSGLREGFVYRDFSGMKSFKNVSRQYLLGHK